MKIKIGLRIIIFLLLTGNSYSQNKSVSIGSLTPDNSAILDLESSSQGFLMTRLDSAQVLSIVNPANGLLVFNKTDQCYWYKKNYAWKRICSTDSLYNKFTYSHSIQVDSLYIGNVPVTNVINNRIDSLAWVLKGNSNAKRPGKNILGSLTGVPLDIRAGGKGRIFVSDSGLVSIGMNTVDASVFGVPSFVMGQNNMLKNRNSIVLGSNNNLSDPGANAGSNYILGYNWITGSEPYNVLIGDGQNINPSSNGSVILSTWNSGLLNPVLSPGKTGEFIVRTDNGAKIYSLGNLTAGVELTTGSGTWASVSDIFSKTNISRVDYREVLKKIETLPVTRWSYRSETAKENKNIKQDVYHMGVMAQDFYSAFGLGVDERLITTLDIGGVSMAAIRALIEENRELKQRMDRLERILKERK